MAAHKVDWRIGGNAHIIGDAIFRIRVISSEKIELVIPALGKPAVDQLAIKPCAPSALQRHTQIGLDHAEANAAQEDPEIDQGQKADSGDVSVLQSVEHRTIPSIHCVCRPHQQDDGEDEPD
jgi:hypothetical protein